MNGKIHVVKIETAPQLTSHFQLLSPTRAISGATQIKYCGLNTLPVINTMSIVRRQAIYKSILSRHCSHHVYSRPAPRSSVFRSETLFANGLRKFSDWYSITY